MPSIAYIVTTFITIYAIFILLVNIICGPPRKNIRDTYWKEYDGWYDDYLDNN